MKYLLSLIITLSLVIASQASFGMLDKVGSVDQISVHDSNLTTLEDQKVEKPCNKISELSASEQGEITIAGDVKRSPSCCGTCGQYNWACNICKNGECRCKQC